MRGDGGVAGSQPMTSTWSPNKLWRSNSIFNLEYVRRRAYGRHPIGVGRGEVVAPPVRMTFDEGPRSESKIIRIKLALRHSAVRMDQITIKTPNPKCRLFLKIDL
jgi:hypothetical protein